ncbi:hypothetical protein FACS1894147_02930 [Spirochaetia bacterium]|nr:hypothetical protein FACS1894147_02930 [Spirochaetia bacterium]
MTIEQTVEIPASRQLLLNLSLPETCAPGKTHIFITLNEERSRRVGFLKDCITVPDNFDIMGRQEIEALFEGAK